MSGGRRADEIVFEPLELLETLGSHAVRFIVIGGLAGNIHGSTTVTLDLDICYARDDENVKALAAALAYLDVTLRGADPGLPFRPDAPAIRNGLNFTFSTRYGSFDCLGDPGGGMTFELLEPNAERVHLGGFDVLVTSLDDLIRMKRAAGRRKDLIEVENLSALREVREEAAPYRVVARRSPVQARPRVRR